MKKLYRSRHNKVIAGVCGGLAEYFGVDVVVVRLIWVLLALMGGPGVLGYIIAWLIMPLEPEHPEHVKRPTIKTAAEMATGTTAETPVPAEATTEGPAETTGENATDEGARLESDSKTTTLLAILLIAVGGFFLLRMLLPHQLLRWLSWSRWWPLVLIIGGAALLLKANSK
ncbi:MAG TPA: PspC domain-containing protein [Firmicutes bacterium]|nr:PspC domain-containing protein [Bacillota bacterium]